MKYFQIKKEAGQEKLKIEDWEYCCNTNRFKKSYKFNNITSKQSSIFAVLLAEINSNEYKIFSDVRKNNRNVYVQIKKELDDMQINKILETIDEAFEEAVENE